MGRINTELIFFLSFGGGVGDRGLGEGGRVGSHRREKKAKSENTEAFFSIKAAAKAEDAAPARYLDLNISVLSAALIYSASSI